MVWGAAEGAKKCADRVKVQALCKGLLASRLEIVLQVETKSLGMALQLETHLTGVG